MNVLKISQHLKSTELIKFNWFLYIFFGKFEDFYF